MSELKRSQQVPDANLDSNGSAPPGRGTLTSRLQPRPIQQVILRVESAEAAAALADRFGSRDGNGVAAGAEPFVQRAAASSGQALPDDVRGRFEASTGADLSGVRVHTGAESADAAAAVGARAYTTGQDIHFAAGQYAPQDPFGVHLLAHEVAHTVQQQGGAQRMQAKLEVSAPQDGAELEADRAADAMVSGVQAAIASFVPNVGRKIMRDDDKDKPKPMPGPAPETPFDESKLSPATIAAIESVAIDSLRSLASTAIGHAHTDYMDACNQIISKLGAEKKAREDKEKEMVAMAIGAAGMLLGPVGAAGGEALAGPVLQKKLIDKVTVELPKILAKDGADAQTRQGLTDAVLKKIASDKVTALLAKADPKTMEGLIGKAAAASAGVVAKVDVRGQKEDKAISYVEALKAQADGASADLQTAAGTCTDAGALIGLHGKFSSARAAMYKIEIDQKAHDFMTQIATTIGDKGNGKDGNNEVVAIDAYGQERLANVRYLSDSANYTFHSWITPDMESIAKGLNPNPKKITPAMCNNHIPEPTKEGAEFGKETYVKADCWGRVRVLVIKAATSWGGFGSNELHFVRWVTDDNGAEAGIRGGMQIGGITTVDLSKVKGVPPPPPDPPPGPRADNSPTPGAKPGDGSPPADGGQAPV